MSMGAILLLFRSLIRALTLWSKVLSLGKIKFLLFFRSLIRTFARVLWKKYNKNIWIRTQLLALC